MVLKEREYKEYEFCKAMHCIFFKRTLIGEPSVTINGCDTKDFICNYTAKFFHDWLKNNGFIIKKKEE